MIRRLTFVVIVLVAACDGGRFSGPRGSTGGGPGTAGGNPASSIVGTWRRILYFIAADGSAGASETIWTFSSNGAASRTSISRNYTAGVADAQTVDARWEQLTQSVRVTFLPPSSGTFEYSFRITGDTLYLASQGYGRVQ